MRVPSKQFAGAVAALEAGIKLMYSEDYGKAVKAFNKVIADYPEEPEIQASAKARIHACEKKLQERARTVFRPPMIITMWRLRMMNSGDLDTAMTHLAVCPETRSQSRPYPLCDGRGQRSYKETGIRLSAT